MRLFARSLLFLLALFLLVWVFRGALYRAIVHYEVIGERARVGALAPMGSTAQDLDAAIEMALDTTAARLHFSTVKAVSDPQELLPGSPANCIGYSALFAALLNGHFVQADLNGGYEVEHVIGKLYIGPWDVHSSFSSPFWKDHDIVRIRDKRTGVCTYVDPTLYDAIGIARGSGPWTKTGSHEVDLAHWNSSPSPNFTA
ncbi:MAG: hypothetical protein RBT71_03530 [Flavobacteriales bacterium]|jgi:hypothetical protein|nr:hypothetical protein [Flavobacteriales bacterium]